jgi:transitional endoplasmic reticulum ATPase
MAEDTLIDSLKAALAASPDNVALRFLLARKLVDAGRGGDALPIVDPVRAEGLDPAQISELALLLLDAGDSERARRVVDDAAMKCRSSARFLHAAARVKVALKDFAGAHASWQQAKEIDPALADAKLEEAIRASGAAPEPRAPLRILVGGHQERGESVLPIPEKTITFTDVGGYDDLKKAIHRKIILPFQKPELFAKYGKQAGGGILMYGPPGCGKTHLARATAGECGATFINVAIEDILDMWRGQSESKLHALFESARAKAPSVMFFDEIEALGGKRSSTYHTESHALISTFLSEMDGFGKNNQKVLIIGATNVPWAVDPAFRRPGRFDNVLFVPPPDRSARESILALLLKNRPAQGIDVAQLAQGTSGFSGADLKHLVETGYDLVIEQAIDTGTEPPLSMAHLKQVLPKLKPTTSEWLSTARNYAMYSNESGQYDEVLAFLKQHGR